MVVCVHVYGEVEIHVAVRFAGSDTFSVVKNLLCILHTLNPTYYCVLFNNYINNN